MNHGGLDAAGAHRLQQRLHDGLGQCLSLAVMQIDEVASADDAEALRRARALLQEALQEVRALIGNIGQPAAVPDADLPDRLNALVRHLNGQQAVPVHCTIDGPSVPVPEPACEILLGATRELLINACKHGQATTVEARLSSLPHRLSITVMQCQGMPLDASAAPRAAPPSFGMGLPATRERLGLIGARLRWRSSRAGVVQARIHWVPQ
ncbi:MAG: sensor histidine kinase [Pseudomonadota bacterium]